jgi:hypothetical protein
MQDNKKKVKTGRKDEYRYKVEKKQGKQGNELKMV